MCELFICDPSGLVGIIVSKRLGDKRHMNGDG